MLHRLTLEQEVYRRDAIYRQPDWSYDATLGRYRNAVTGRFLSQRDALQLTSKAVAAGQQEMASLTDQLANGLLSLPDWQRRVAQIIKEIHIGQYILGRGGVKTIVPADYLEIARILKAEYGFLDGFAKEIAQQRLSVAQVKARINLYIAKARLSYWKGFAKGQQQAQKPRQMRRHLSPAENCPDCIGYARAGWVPAGTLPMPTEDCQCGSNCKCIVEYRDTVDQPLSAA